MVINPLNSPEKPVQITICSFFAVCLMALVLLCQSAEAGSHPTPNLGGHLRLRGEAGDPKAGSLLDIRGKDRLYDTSFDFRAKSSLDLSNRCQIDLHYEMLGTAGDTLEAETAVSKSYPLARRFIPAGPAEDERRLMDLTHVISGEDDYRLYHRIDRLVLSSRYDWGTFRIGRQALTWGNGFLFNPMDLFNPFSPTDVERDYKIGDDMVTFQAHTSAGEIQMLYVPRRQPATGNVTRDQSSAAAKYHRYVGNLEIDLMAAVHYDDIVAAAGMVGYLGGAAWRLDAAYTWLDQAENRNGFADICLNLDYSWVWFGKNMYGWIEYYYTGLGTDNYEKALADPDIMERIRREERFTLGRSYLDANLQVELHPLVNFNLTLITNTQDSSGSIQPRLIWDAGQNFQITCGANLYRGGTGTEFGGIDLPKVPFSSAPADSVYLWTSFYY